MNQAEQHLQRIRSGMRNMRNMAGVHLQNSPGFTGRRTQNWNANGSAGAMPTTSPIILQVSNGSVSNVSNFDILGCSQYLYGNFGGGSWSNGGNFTLNNVTISSVFGSTVSYQQILSSTQNNPFTAGSVYLQSISGNASQVTDVYSITSNTQDGKLYTEPIKPYLDPMQLNANLTYNTTSFNVGSLTKMTWNTIYASAVFQISIFPAQVIDPSQGLDNRPVQTAYARPQVIGNLRNR